MKRLRILMLSPQFHPIVGGYERAAERLSIELAKRGHHVTVITERRKNEWPDKETINGVFVRRLICLYQPRIHMFTSIISFSIYLLIHGRSFDLWHVHQYGHHAALASALGLILKKPTILKITSSSEQGLNNAIRKNRFAFLSAFLIKRFSAVVATTRETVCEASAFGIAINHIHRIGNGVDLSKYYPKSKEEISCLKKKLGINCKRLIIFVGRLSYEKNPVGLIKAWNKAYQKLTDDWQMVMVGDGPMWTEICNLISELECSHSIIMVGQRGNIEEWLSIADVYVISSYNEGLSNTMLEAMAVGLPVVTTSVSGVSELIEAPGAGLIVPISDIEGLSKAITTLASDNKLRKKMGAIARKVVSQDYSIATIAKKHEDLYYSIATVLQ